MENKWFLGFTNCIVDLRDLSTRNHEKSLCCLHGIPVPFKATSPSIKTMDFFLDLSGRDPIKINLFRSFLYMIFTNKTDLEIAPYFYGKAGMEKSTLLEFIQKISYGNCVSMDLNTWSSSFGKFVAIGASIILFDDINYYALTYAAASEIKRFVSGLPLMVNRKHMSLIELGNGIIFSTSNKPFSHHAAKKLRDDGGFIRRFLGIPIKRSSKTHHYESSADLINVLVEDTGFLLSWVLALNKDCLPSIKQGVPDISNYLVSESETQTVNRATIEFVCQNLRLCSSERILGGYRSNPETGTVNFLLQEHMKKQEVVGDWS